MQTQAPTPKPRYERHGRTVHLVLEKMTDLDHVLELDDVLWLATTAPTSDFLLPPAFLKRLDLDQDGRIRVEELKSSIRWFRQSCSAQTPGSTLAKEELTSEALLKSWSKIAQAFEEGEELLLDLDAIAEMRERYKKDPIAFSSGSLLPEELSDRAAVELLEAVQRTQEPDEEAVTEEQFDLFFQQAEALLKWQDASPGENRWADQYPVFRKLSGKLEEYFFLADTESYAGQPKLPEWAISDSTGQLREALQTMPLARPLSQDGLRFESHLNPAFRDDLLKFQRTFLENGKLIFTREDYLELKSRFATYSDWLENAPDTTLGDIESEKLKQWIDDENLQKTCLAALRTKREKGLVLKDFAELESVLLMKAHLLNFCRNFVAFPDLYNPEKRALFERGTLVMDGREFHLSVPVDDLSHHKEAARRSNIFVLYVEVEGKTLAVPVTSGDQGFLATQKRGIFNHVDGTEKEARVVDLVTNPISFWEALVAPFQKITNSLKERLEKMSSDRESEFVKGVTTKKAQAPPASAASHGPMLAGGGVALAAIGSSFAFILKTLAGLTVGKVLMGFLLMFLAFLLPAALVAFIKLRNRDLSAVLEGNAWGINARMKLTYEQARQFTQQPKHPGAVSSRKPAIVAAVVVLVLAALAYRFQDSILLLFA